MSKATTETTNIYAKEEAVLYIELIVEMEEVLLMWAGRNGQHKDIKAEKLIRQILMQRFKKEKKLGSMFQEATHSLIWR